MSKDYDDALAPRPQQLQTMPDQKAANSLALTFREDGNRRQRDCTASGTARVAGSENIKPKYRAGDRERP